MRLSSLISLAGPWSTNERQPPVFRQSQKGGQKLFIVNVSNHISRNYKWFYALKQYIKIQNNHRFSYLFLMPLNHLLTFSNLAVWKGNKLRPKCCHEGIKDFMMFSLSGLAWFSYLHDKKQSCFSSAVIPERMHCLWWHLNKNCSCRSRGQAQPELQSRSFPGSLIHSTEPDT